MKIYFHLKSFYFCKVQSKNYYQILGISASATNAEIKAAYRKLAFKYHPDKHLNQDNAKDLIIEINEAYATLSNKDSKKQYDAKHPEFFVQKIATASVYSTEYIYQKLVEIKDKIADEDPFRMNRDSLEEALTELFSPYHLAIIKEDNNKDTNNKMIDAFLIVSSFLSYEKQKKALLLFDIFPHDKAEKISKCLKKQKSIWFWHKYQSLIVLLLTLVICAILYFILHQSQ